MSRLDLSTKKAPLLALAPMAGASDKAMRILAHEYGADLLFSEMVSAKALTFSNDKTKNMLDTSGERGKTAIQLFGSELDSIREGAKIAVSLGAKWLDFNMGCPVPKVAGHGEGAALLKEPELAFQIAKTLVESVDVPISIKVRIGWDKYDKGFFTHFIQGLSKEGVDLISIHGRTREEYYTGQANWEAIRDAVLATEVPILANGDVDSPQKAKEILEVTGAKGVMIGRGALGAPWLFSTIKEAFNGNKTPVDPTLKERAELILRHAYLLVEDKGEYIAIREMRKHIGYYVRGLTHAKLLRTEAVYLETLEDLRMLMSKWTDA